MSNSVTEKWDAAVKILERQREDSAEEFEAADEEMEINDHLKEAIEELKKTTIMLEWLSDPDFCKTITKRERKAILKRLEQLYMVTDAAEEALNDFEEDVEELSDL
jgi:hypothetical protein